MADLVTVQFSNNSNTSFERDNFGLSSGFQIWDIAGLGLTAMDKIFVAFETSPAQTLEGMHTQSFSISDTSLALFSYETLAKTAFDAFCVWRNPDTGDRFGIKVHVPVQILEIGTRPYWLIMSDNAAAGADVNWISSGDDPSTPYTFEHIGGLNIVVTPTSGHSSLALDVDIAAS